MIYHILTTAVLAAFVIFAALDFSVSVKFPYYGLQEANKLFRDDYRNFSLKKGVIVTAIPFAAAIILWIFLHPIAGAILVAPALAKIAFLYFDNVKAMRNRRKEQIAKLRELRGLVADGADTSYFWARLNIEMHIDHTAYVLFRWIGVGLGPDWPGRLRPIIEDLSQKPESEWFEK